MRWLRQVAMRGRMLAGRGDAVRRLDEELQFHLERQIAENVANGMSSAEARRAALRSFGNPAVVREEARGSTRWGRCGVSDGVRFVQGGAGLARKFAARAG